MTEVEKILMEEFGRFVEDQEQLAEERDHQIVVLNSRLDNFGMELKKLANMLSDLSRNLVEILGE